MNRKTIVLTFALLLLLMIANVNLYCPSVESVGKPKKCLGGNWEADGTWEPPGKPGPEDDVVIPTDTQVWITSSEKKQVNSLTVEAYGVISSDIKVNIEIEATENIDVTGSVGYSKGGMVSLKANGLLTLGKTQGNPATEGLVYGPNGIILSGKKGVLIRGTVRGPKADDVPDWKKYDRGSGILIESAESDITVFEGATVIAGAAKYGPPGIAKAPDGGDLTMNAPNGKVVIEKGTTVRLGDGANGNATDGGDGGNSGQFSSTCDEFKGQGNIKSGKPGKGGKPKYDDDGKETVPNIKANKISFVSTGGLEGSQIMLYAYDLLNLSSLYQGAINASDSIIVITGPLGIIDLTNNSAGVKVLTAATSIVFITNTDYLLLDPNVKIADITSPIATISPARSALTDPKTFYEGTTGWPHDADPALAYTQTDGELLFSSMQGLIGFSGEQYYNFKQLLATNVPTRQDITMTVTNTSVVGTEPTNSTWTNGTKTYTLKGWVDEGENGFNNGDIIYINDGTTWRTWTADTVSGTSTITMSLWRGSYVLNIRTSPTIWWYDSAGDHIGTFSVTDAVYSFQRAFVLDVPGGPIWMFDKPFFDQPYHFYWTNATAMDLAHLIKDAIVGDTIANTLTLNVGCRFPDNAFKQSLSSTWGSIESKSFVVGLGSWNGNLFETTKYHSSGGNYPDWWIDWANQGDGINTNNDPYNKLDASVYCSSGPYHVALIDQVNSKVILQKNPDYWEGWPAPGCSSNLDTIEIDYIADWTLRKARFLAGTIDTCAVPINKMSELLSSSSREPTNPGIKTIKNIVPTQAMDAALLQFGISSSSPYIGTGSFPNGIPTDFFNNTHVRKAFMYSFNITQYNEQVYYGESNYRKNPLVLGLYPDYYNDSNPGYDINYAAAENELKQAVINGQNVWNSGFTFNLTYNIGNDIKKVWCTMISTFFQTLSTFDGRTGPTFAVTVSEINWSATIKGYLYRTLPIYNLGGWLADFADADDFIRPYMYSYGDFAYYQGYTAANGWGNLKDTLIDQAVLTPDGQERQTLYQQLQMIYYNDAPSMPLNSPKGRRWCWYWVKGWYYDAAYPSTYYYTIWKNDNPWLDVTGSTPGVSDGIVNMRDIAYLIAHFNAKAPVPGLLVDPKWVGMYGANGCVDPYGDRICNMRDIQGAILNFNAKPPGHP